MFITLTRYGKRKCDFLHLNWQSPEVDNWFNQAMRHKTIGYGVKYYSNSKNGSWRKLRFDMKLLNVDKFKPFLVLKIKFLSWNMSHLTLYTQYFPLSPLNLLWNYEVCKLEVTAWNCNKKKRWWIWKPWRSIASRMKRSATVYRVARPLSRALSW